MDLEVRPIEDGEVDEWERVVSRGFGGHLNEATVLIIRRPREPGRALAAYDGGVIVGGATAYALNMVVPGGTLRTAGVDAVSVQPTHRRRGVLTGMMAHQLRDFHERGEVLAALGSSESIIYGRFGYGIGALREDWTIDRPHTAFAGNDRAVAERSLRFLGVDEAKRIYPEISDRAFSSRPGYLRFNDALWDVFLADAEPWRQGASAFFHVVCEGDSGPEGYVAYRIRGSTLHVVSLAGVTPEAHATLWRYCFDVDLMSTTIALKRPLDDPLPWMLADPRRLKRSVRDDLWLRLVDVQRALEGRRYAATGSLTIRVRDPFCEWNDGTYRLVGGADGAECTSSSSTPDLTLTVGDLAAIYLGAVSFDTLRRAGRVEASTPAALRLADAMFATDLQPWWPNDL